MAEEKKTPRKKKSELVQTLGQRRSAVARAIAKPGTGKIIINNKPLELISPEPVRLFITEPLRLAEETAKTVDVSVNVRGGGMFGQAEAARQAIAIALVKFNPKLKETFLTYDRALLVADPRRNEPHKPSRSSAGPRRHKQRSKR
jgi:small subunit ribosomal protein S9